MLDGIDVAVWHDVPVPPQHCPSPRELDDLELLLSGALAPRTTFDDVITLDLPPDLRDAPVGRARRPRGAAPGQARRRRSGSPLWPRRRTAPFRRLHLSPARHPGVRRAAGRGGHPAADRGRPRRRSGSPRTASEVLLLALVGHGTPRGATPGGAGAREPGRRRDPGAPRPRDRRRGLPAGRPRRRRARRAAARAGRARLRAPGPHLDATCCRRRRRPPARPDRAPGARRTSPGTTSGAWWSSSPACPAAASRPSPGPCTTCSSRTAGAP